MGKRKRPCYWLWNTMIIRWNGEVVPCCYHEDAFDIGNVFEENIVSIWRNEKYRRIREGFGRRNYGQGMHPTCRKCYNISALSEALGGGGVET
jgi:radical SAM protein with 4Fe4S-binding SPASM domain